LRGTAQIPFAREVYNTAVSYPAPTNLTHFWNFGVYSLFCLVIQIVTGLFLAMHYTPDINLAFISVEHIMRDVNYGYLLRYVHANGASMFFIVVYLHTFRGLFYTSFFYPRQYLWCVGVVILLIMILTAFLGYVLPWGQMSFWGATVITNLCSAIPVVGPDIVIWLWGGYSIDNATLVRFFSFHFLFPFIILGLSFVHLMLLHLSRSNNPLGVEAYLDYLSFYPYYIIKDLYGLFFLLVPFMIFVGFYPNLLGHPDNYIEANPLVTPPHIVPEWYFLTFYAILRAIPDKLLGVVALLAAIVVLLFLPLLQKPEIRSMEFRPLSQILFWFFFVNALILGWIGSKPVEYPFIQIGQISGFLYFALLIFFMPFVIMLEDFLASYQEKTR